MILKTYLTGVLAIIFLTIGILIASNDDEEGD